jgi:two-component system phosphate regulon response regulator OmpR
MSEQVEKILVVDDDARLRGLLQRFLEEQGYAVKAVADADQMDRALSREIYSLMVLDLMLPGEDGLSICRRLRDDDNRLPIIMLTAKGDDSERIEGLDAGADDYLPKPFNPKELSARIRAVLRRHVREVPAPWPARASRSRSPPASSRCSRRWCRTSGNRSPATS